MAIKLTWESAGSIEYFNVYRSANTIDINKLPIPIATGILQNTYIDNDILQSGLYTYVISSVQHNRVKFSDHIIYNNFNLLKTETFDTDPAGKFSIRSGSPTVSWDSANKRLFISGNESQHFISWDALGNFTDNIVFEMDILFFGNASNRFHFGLYLDSGSSGSNGYRFATLDTNFMASQWVNTVESNGGAANINPITYILGTTYTLRCERINRKWSVYINNVKLPNEISILNQYNGLRPGFFVYGSAVYINEFRVYG